MELNNELTLSYYKEISVINAEHGVYLVQHTENGRIFVRKQLRIYNKDVYLYLKDHPIAHTPAIYEVLEDNNLLIVIEEYINGSSLEEILADKKTLPPSQAADIIRQLCNIVNDMHNAPAPIIHRDIKPPNIMLSDKGEVTLLDMSAAKPLHDEKNQDTNLIGTYHYAAPEQYGFGQSVPQTDIYALGVLLNVMLTGAFPSQTIATKPFEHIISKCTCLDPKDRYESAAALRSEIDKVSPIQTARTFSAREDAPITSDSHIRWYLPAGFRALKPLRMILTLAGYVLLVVLSLTLHVEGATGAALWINRIFFFLFFFVGINLLTNWFNIWGALKLKKPLKILVMILIILGSEALLLSIMTILLSIVK